MKRLFFSAAALCALLTAACASTNGDKPRLPVCKPDLSNQPCEIPLPPPRCPPGTPDPSDPFCRQQPPIPPLPPLPPHR